MSLHTLETSPYAALTLIGGAETVSMQYSQGVRFARWSAAGRSAFAATKTDGSAASSGCRSRSSTAYAKESQSVVS